MASFQPDISGVFEAERRDWLKFRQKNFVEEVTGYILISVLEELQFIIAAIWRVKVRYFIRLVVGDWKIRFQCSNLFPGQQMTQLDTIHQLLSWI